MAKVEKLDLNLQFRKPTQLHEDKKDNGSDYLLLTNHYTVRI